MKKVKKSNMPTTKQKKVAKAMVKNMAKDKPDSAGQVLKSVGYGTGLQTQPKRVLESEGVQEELQILGFTEENAMTVVSEIMLNPKAQDNNRLKAAEQVFKVTGSYAPEKKAVVNLNVEIDNSRASQIAEEYEQKLKDEE